MESIKKTVSLEEYKCRFNYKIPHINGSDIHPIADDNWGKIPYDYYFKTLDDCPFSKIKDNIPLVKGLNAFSTIENIETVEYCFRFKQMIYWYNWLTNYGKNCKYYKLCKRNTQYVWVNLNTPKTTVDFFVSDYNLGLNNINSITYLPITFSEYEIGDVIEVNSDAEYFNKIFRLADDDTRYELLVLNFIDEYFNENTVKNNLSIPFIDIPVHITQNIDDLGISSSYVKEWEPRKTYMVGDTVMYRQNIYILNGGDTYNMLELRGSLYELFLKYLKSEINISLYYNFVELKNINDEVEPEQIVYDTISKRKNIFYEIKNDITKIYMPFLCHKAVFNKLNNDFIFDTNLWQLNILNEDSNVNGNSGIMLGGILTDEKTNESFIKTLGDSKLNTIRRYKKSVDEDGNILPFILDANSSTDGELEYNVGVFNVYIGGNDIFRGDVMVDITFNNDNETTQFKYDNNGKTLIIKKITKKFSAAFDDEIKLNNNIILKNDEKNNSFTYTWQKIKTTTTIDESVEVVSNLPKANENSFDKKYQTTAFTDNILYYTTYVCVKENMILIYSGVSDEIIYIKPSLLHINNETSKMSGDVTFTYLKDCFLNIDEKKCIKKYLENTGLLHTESYNYEISVAAINLISSKKNEENVSLNHKYVLYDYELRDNDVVCDTIDKDNKTIYNYKNVGKIYGIKGSNGTIYKYMRLLSEYTFIDINFETELYEVTSTDDSNLKKNTLLSNIYYNLENIGYDDFQKDYIFKDENMIGIQDVTENINVKIERGISSSFEKHHILCEVKSFSDLENYRNNLFNL